MKNDTQIRTLIEEIVKFRDARDWAQFHDPKNMAISLQLEASEVLELFQWTKDNQIKDGKAGEIADELSDVFYWLLLLAQHYNIDLVEALKEKMKKNEAKYPIDKAKGRSAKYTDLA